MQTDLEAESTVAENTQPAFAGRRKAGHTKLCVAAPTCATILPVIPSLSGPSGDIDGRPIPLRIAFLGAGYVAIAATGARAADT